MSETTEREIGPIGIGDPLAAPTHPIDVPEHDVWDQDIDKGFAWVFYAGDDRRLTRPVIIADGFNHGRSELDKLYQFLDGEDYPFLTELRRSGRDVILLGFDERTASILENSKAAEATIRKAIERRDGNERLVVGGFSMGGLITRYTLARMETDFPEDEHQTGVYFSFDTPHRGATIPVGVQAFSYLLYPFGQNEFALQMNSPAAREMLWQHYDNATGKIDVAPERKELLDELDRVGNWPQIPRRIGVANGRADGVGLPSVKPGDVALRLLTLFGGTTFYTQAQGDATSAFLRRHIPPVEKTITTEGFPELDGAPGGTLPTYGILDEAIREKKGKTELHHPEICFVPSVSAVDIRDFANQRDLYAPVDELNPSDSGLHKFLCSPTTTPHTLPTEELCTWLLREFDA
ncbi:esterase/lipase family protein [Streptomyces sp. NPDC059894]|uniref:esterase/lipase family protein n=1 Tax=unclassified Streptomyces TaxID=2593676 RepID=UPI0036490335